MKELNSNELPNPDSYPEVVYKYRCWNNEYQQRTLLNREIFLSSPKLFNDPFDCKIPVAYWLLKEDSELAHKYFNQVVTRHFPLLSASEHGLEVKRLLNDKRFEDEKWLEEQELEAFQKIGQQFGVLSVSEIKDDIRMWSHYSNSHKGFCIGFKSRKLFFQNERFGQGAYVDYVDEFPLILPTENYMNQYKKILYSKLKDWEYEKEYRLIKSGAANTKFNFEPDEVHEIILGCSISEENEKSILNICGCIYPGVPILKSKQNHRRFALNFEQIQ